MVPPPQHTQMPNPAPAPAPTPAPNPRKRRASFQSTPLAAMAPSSLTGAVEAEGNPAGTAATPDSAGKKKGRTNTPWTAEEEQRLKTMRESGSTWSEIAKVCPTRPIFYSFSSIVLIILFV